MKFSCIPTAFFRQPNSKIRLQITLSQFPIFYHMQIKTDASISVTVSLTIDIKLAPERIRCSNSTKHYHD